MKINFQNFSCKHLQTDTQTLPLERLQNKETTTVLCCCKGKESKVCSALRVGVIQGDGTWDGGHHKSRRFVRRKTGGDRWFGSGKHLYVRYKRKASLVRAIVRWKIAEQIQKIIGAERKKTETPTQGRVYVQSDRSVPYKGTRSRVGLLF